MAMKREGNFFNKLRQVLFYSHLFLITILAIFLIIRGGAAARSHSFHPFKWYAPVFAAIGCAEILGFLWQTLLSASPSRAIKAAFWLGPLLTCAIGIFFILVGTPGSLVAAAISLVYSASQSLYACWVNPRIEYAVQILSISAAPPPRDASLIVLVSLIFTTLYSCLLMAGIGGATATGKTIDKLFIFLILLSLTWTMHTIKNTVQVSVSFIKYMKFASGTEIATSTAIKSTFKNHSLGSIYLGSFLVPVLGVVRGSARAMSSVAGDVDEFMFSCASCYSSLAAKIITCANRWGFVLVGVYGKGIVQASADSWEMFRRAGMEELINSDLTSSLCFLCGVSTGAVCGLLGGTWALLTCRSYATELSLYAFLIGYLTARVAMAWPQASVSAYYVAYAENPHSQRFESAIPVRLEQLQKIQAVQLK